MGRLHEVADCCRNQDASCLRAYAAQQGRLLVTACEKHDISGTHWILGGSLAYNAALKDSYDIDLRLLVPDGPNVRKEIDHIRDLLAQESKGDPTFKTRFIDEGGTNYVQHTKRIVRIPGIDADIELSWNIQAESSYRSIGEMAARLPHEVIDRFVVTKWNAREEGKDAYKAIKSRWRQMIERLINQGGRSPSAQQLGVLLNSLKSEYSEFLCNLHESVREE